MKSEKTKTYVFLILLTLIVRIAVRCLFFSDKALETFEYETIALNLFNGKGYIYNHFTGITYALIAPLYTYLTYSVYCVFGYHPHILIFLQCIFSSILAILVYQFSFILYQNKQTSLIASFLVIFHPGLLYYDIIKLHPQSLGTLLIFSLGITFIYFYKKRTALWALFFGICAGLNILERSITMPFILLSLPFLLITVQPYHKKCLVLLSLLICGLIISPWIIRNYRIFNTLVITTNTGEVFWRSNNPQANGTSYSDQSTVLSPNFYAQHVSELKGKDELYISKFYLTHGLHWIQKNPAHFVKLYLKKVFSFLFVPLIKFYGNYTQTLKKALLFYYYIISAFLIFTFCLTLAKKNLLPPIFYPMLILYVSILCTQSFFYLEGRHRMLADPILFVYISGGIHFLFQKIKLLIFNGLFR